MYLVGGDSSTQVQSINFDSVKSLEDAKKPIWRVLAELSVAVNCAGVQYLNNQLIVFSAVDSPNGVIQTCDLGSNLCKKSSEEVIDAGTSKKGLKFPGSYETNSSVTIFGGYSASEACIQQTGKSHNSNPWQCVASGNTVLDGLVYRNGVKMYLSFANYFV